MYQRILIATDGSALSKKAVSSGIALAAITAAQIVAIKVIPHYPVSYSDGGVAVCEQDVAKTEKQWAEAAQTVVDGVKAEAEASGVKAKAVIIESDFIAEAIIAAAKNHNCDLIVMASHGRRGIKHLLLGGETQHVLTHSHVPVLVLK
ncbi:MAG: universal stress protein UspA [Burkholderiales bacterium RIFCSPHIGHO2_12_FULL_61_11]|nr:MAG: universal stress protein UspA [Burkholderiales bacterium RIFCSPHIGHO2_12_FULL_61_11]